jgi:sugar phosphate permease
MAQLIDNEYFTKREFGNLLGMGSIAVLIGNYILGVIIDIFGPRKIALLVVFVILTSTLGLLFSSNIIIIGFFYSLYNFHNSASWPNNMKIVKNWIPSNIYGKIKGILSTSSQLGRVFSHLFLGFF